MPDAINEPGHPRSGACVPSAFSCLRTDAGPEEARLTLLGELDLSTAAELDRALRGAQATVKRLTLDLRRLEFMDCRGMRVVEAAAVRARESGGLLVIVGGPPQVHRLFTLTGTRPRLELAG
jgi:anti-anti-sigma factor